MDASTDHHPTLLTAPHIHIVGLSDNRVGPETHILDLPPDEYVIRQDGALWQVRHVTTMTLIYAGPGPVSVARSPAPF